MRIGKQHLINNGLLLIAAIFSALTVAVVFTDRATAQETAAPTTSVSPRFRIGEKLTYSVSFGKYTNAAYFETSVVSEGKLSGHDVVELKSTLKTLGFVSAAFYQFDENRTVYVAPDTGLPLYVTKTANFGVFPKETIHDYLKEPTLSFEMLSAIYKARHSNGEGSFTLFEEGQVYTVTLGKLDSEKVKTEAGEFETDVSHVKSDYLDAKGIKQFKINFTADEYRVPVLFRFKTAKGVVTASVAAIQLPKPATDATVEPSKSPSPAATPPAKSTPTPYIEDQPISAELGFAVGESQDYSVTESGQRIATITLAAKERRKFQDVDSLLLSATVTAVEPGNTTFVNGDSVNAQVDPETLAPRWIEFRFAGALKHLNRVITFDPRSGKITFGGASPVDAPIGTHSLVSLIYAMRSFNLKPSKDPKHPVNDTRVAVFWETQPYIFTLLPSNPEEITVGSEKVMAQMISITTGNGPLDKGSPKVWLNANDRVPVRFSLGRFQADLISPPKTLPQ